jgi:pyruvate dehydrogenase E2 component (dihydrolipoamide acetyltransferase)
MSNLLEVRMPRYDPSMDSGKIVKWIKNEGDNVNKGDPLVLIETEKITVEYPSPYSGRLEKIIHKEGTVAVGEIIAYISPTQGKQEIREPFATPAARRLAREYNLDLSKIVGSGPQGRITAEDVMKHLKESSVTKPEEQYEEKVSEYEIIELSKFRSTIAEKMSKSAKNIPHVPLFFEVFFDEVYKMLDAFKKRNIELSLSSFIIKAAALALSKNLILNSSFEENKIRIYKKINIGYALETKEGLLVVVIRDADKKSLIEINKELENLKNKAASNKLELQDVLGSTFTITNLGPYGINYFIPIINYPQSAILAVGKIEDTLKIFNNQYITKKSAILTLVFDHRVTDGAEACKFIKEFKELLENPLSLII